MREKPNPSVGIQGFIEISLVFMSEALLRYLIQFKRQRFDAATAFSD